MENIISMITTDQYFVKIQSKANSFDSTYDNYFLQRWSKIPNNS